MKDDPKVTPEMIDLLKQLKGNLGTWAESPEHLTDLNLVSRQRENLIRLKGVLEELSKQDEKRLADLHEQLTRLKHGGGY